MGLVRLPDLDRHDVVPAEAADHLVDTVRGELAQLEAELEQLLAEAAAAERELAAVGPPSNVALRARYFVEDFVAQMRQASEVELARALDYARARAATRLAEADLEAGANRAVVEVERAPEAPAAAVVEAPVPEPLAAPVDLVPPPADLAPPVLDAPEVDSDDGSAALAPPTIDDAALAAAARVVPPTFDDFWAEESQAKRTATRITRIPIEAVLPMLAVLIVLIVVLAWVG